MITAIFIHQTQNDSIAYRVDPLHRYTTKRFKMITIWTHFQRHQDDQNCVTTYNQITIQSLGKVTDRVCLY